MENNEKQCVYKKCMNHEPEWKDVGDIKVLPNPAFFGLKMT